MNIRLRSLSPSGRVADFSGPTVQLGRDPLCEMPAQDDAVVSWLHARIELRNGTVLLHDLNSTNGTYVNGRRVAGTQQLSAGDRVQLGLRGPEYEVVAIEGATAGAGSGSPPMSQTRAMLLGHQSRQRTLWTALVMVASVAFVAIGYILWDHQTRIGRLEKIVGDHDLAIADVQKRQDEIDIQTRDIYTKVERLKLDRSPSAEDVYAKALVSTAYIQAANGVGTGVLIDRKRRLVATAYHVIHEQKVAPDGELVEEEVKPSPPPTQVVFPRFLGGKVLANERHYDGKDVINAKLWASDPGRDLAILQLESVPEYVPEVQLAAEPPAPAARVHGVGGKPDRSVGLWTSSLGSVRQLGRGEYNFGTGQKINARVLQTSNPINRGDSGGPLVNDKAQLVGIASGGPEGVNGMSLYIDVAELKELLAKPVLKRLDELAAPKYKPEEPTEAAAKWDLKENWPSEADKAAKLDGKVQELAQGEGKVWVLLAIDSMDPNIGPSCVRDGETLTRMFRDGVPAERLHLHQMRDKQINISNLSRYFRSLPVGPQDTLFFQYSGHGGYSGRHHYLTAWGGGNVGPSHNIPRSGVLGEMMRRKARLTILLTDCCSSMIQGKVNTGTQSYSFPNRPRGGLANLFLDRRGLIDWTAAQYGTDAYGDVFTPALVETIQKRNGDLSWPEVFRGVHAKTREHQRPMSIHYYIR